MDALGRLRGLRVWASGKGWGKPGSPSREVYLQDSHGAATSTACRKGHIIRAETVSMGRYSERHLELPAFC